MLLQNPQLSYALLQAQVVMQIVSPEIAQVDSFFRTLILMTHIFYTLVFFNFRQYCIVKLSHLNQFKLNLGLHQAMYPMTSGVHLDLLILEVHLI